MLVLKRDRGERVTIQSLDANGRPLSTLEISIERGGQVRLGFAAEPGRFKILRSELLDSESDRSDGAR